MAGYKHSDGSIRGYPENAPRAADINSDRSPPPVTHDPPKPPSGGSSGVKIPPGTARYVAESDARREFYEAMTELVRGITPAAITLATILTEAAKKDSKS